MGDTNANRKRRLLAALDRALSRLGVEPPRRPARPAPATLERRQRAQTSAASARRSYGELRDAIRRQGGIRPNRDYPTRLIPSELRAKRGRGLAPDEMAQVLSSRGVGLHYDGDVEMFRDIERRRESRAESREVERRTRSRTGGGQTVCGPVNRGPDGRFRAVR